MTNWFVAPFGWEKYSVFESRLPYNYWPRLQPPPTPPLRIYMPSLCLCLWQSKAGAPSEGYAMRSGGGWWGEVMS
jgi:hypothetical protein